MRRYHSGRRVVLVNPRLRIEYADLPYLRRTSDRLRTLETWYAHGYGRSRRLSALSGVLHRVTPRCGTKTTSIMHDCHLIVYNLLSLVFEELHIQWHYTWCYPYETVTYPKCMFSLQTLCFEIVDSYWMPVREGLIIFVHFYTFVFSFFFFSSSSLPELASELDSSEDSSSEEDF